MDLLDLQLRKEEGEMGSDVYMAVIQVIPNSG
jgi:hypothetical protein